jgi:hypothetical protein
MAFTTIITRYSLISGTVPNGASFQDGELALNIGPGDGTLYYKVSGSTQMLPIRAGSSSFALTGGTGGGSALTVRNQGVQLSSATTTIDFVGAGVSASLSGSGVIRVTIITGSTTWGAISGIPTGLVSSSVQINSGSFSGSFFGVYTPRQHTIPNLDATWDLGTGALRFRTLFVQNVSSSTPIQSSISSSWAAFARSASWAPPAPGQVVEVRDENTVVTSTLSILNFTGAGVSSSLSGSVVNVIIPGGGGGGTALEIRDENVPVTASVGVLNFTGTGVTANRSGSVVNITIPGGGGGSGSISRTSVSFTTPSINAGSVFTGSLAGFGKTFVLFSVLTSTHSRIRLYGSSSFRDADVSRPIGTDPTTENGVIVDLVLSGSSALFNFALSPIVNGVNLDEPADNSTYYPSTNLGTSSTTIDLTFNRVVLEA